MRNRKAFFSVAIAGAAMLLAGTVVMAGGPKRTKRAKRTISSLAVAQPSPSPLTECSPPGTEMTFTVSRGPDFVPCGEGDQCTEIEYEVSGFGGLVYALEGKGVVSVDPFDSELGSYLAEPCEGIDSFGEGSCHEQAIRTFPDEGRKFRITLEGQRRPSPTSVAIFGEGPRACEILGIGLENSSNPEQATQTTETINFKGCVVEFTRDAKTGEVVNAQLTEDSPENCTSPFLEGRTLRPQPVADLELRVTGDGPFLGFGKFGDGYISTGGDSCTTRVIGGKVYTWGSPCPPK
jgi:hypothetical protein